MKNSKGFTLIELLAVILILGVIALIAIPSVNNVIRQSRMGANKTTAQEMIKAARQYFTTCQINGGKTLAQTSCHSNFKEAATGLDGTANLAAVESTAALKAELELSGEIPELANITTFYIDTASGDAYLEFTKDGFKCYNFTGTETKTLSDEVTCEEVTA